MQDLSDFLSPVDVSRINEDNEYTDGQFAKHISIYETEIPDINEADIVLIGVGERRGTGLMAMATDAADQIRKQFYALHYWHTDIKIADWGNIKSGALLNDTYAALQMVLAEVLKKGKTAVILGGTHDLTLAQCNAYRPIDKIIETTCIDALIDLRGDSMLRADNFLLEMLTGEPNIVRHYNHVGFQSYYVHPRLLETLDKLRFDCYRVGIVKEMMEEMEPVFRNSDAVSFDISAIKNSDAPANQKVPNGLNGEEACTLAQYAGMSTHLSTFGVYGYHPEQDVNDITAQQIAQMIWYFIDGKNKLKNEPPLMDLSAFKEYHTIFAEVETLFLQNKRTGRWWMQLPDKKFIACTKKDYQIASMNEMPERWLRAQERLV